MAQTNYTPISLYYSTTASAVPTAANLVPGELAINTADGKLYYEDSSGVVQVLATKSTGSIGGSNTQVQFNNSGSLGGSSGLTWDGSFLTTSSIKNSALTSGRVTYAGASGLLSDSSTFVFNGNLGLGAATTSGGRLVITQDNAVQPAIYLPTDESTIQGPSANTKILMGGNLTVQSANVTTISAKNASGYIVFATGSTPTEGLRLTTSSLYTASGVNVGIGTSSPNNNLEVYSTSNPSIALTSTSASLYSYFGMTSGTVGAQLYTFGQSYSAVYPAGSTALANDTYGLILNASNASGILRFQTNATERMRIDSSGNVGIGTNSPAALLNVSGALGSSAYSEIARFTNTSVNSGTKLTFYGVQGVQTPALLSGSIGFNQTFNQNNNGQPAFIIEVGNSGSISEKVRVTYDGNLLVGTSSNTTNGGFIFSTDFYGAGRSTQIIGHINGASSGDAYMVFNYNGTGIGSITQSGTSAVLYNVTSDQRLKTNVVNAPSGNIDSIKVRSFDWIADGSHQEYGMVAQELIEVAPYAVNKPENPDEMMGVDYSKLVPLMIKEIQDLKAEVNQLKAKIGV